MIHFYEVSSRLRDAIMQLEEKEKIKDKDIAKFLELSPQYYAVIKRRGKIPYESIAHFCKKYRLNMNWILLDQKPVYLT